MGRRSRPAGVHPLRPHPLPREGTPLPRRLRPDAARVPVRHREPDDRHGDRVQPRRRRGQAGAEEHRGAGGDRQPALPDRAGAVQPRDQRAAPPAGLPGRLRLRGRPAHQPQPGGEQVQRGPRPHGDDRHPADPRGRPPEPLHDQPQPALQAAQRPDPGGPGRGPGHRHPGRRAAPDDVGVDHAGGCLHEHPAAHPGEPGQLRGVLERLAGDQRDPARRSARTRRTCWARSCGGRPGSRCSSRPPTPGARSSRSRASGRASGSASAGSPRSSTCSRRTSATSRRCSRSPTTRTRSRSSRAAAPRACRS